MGAVRWKYYIFESLIVNLSLFWSEFACCCVFYSTSLCCDLDLAPDRKSDEFGAHIIHFPYLRDYIAVLYKMNCFIHFVQLCVFLRWNDKYNIYYFLMTWTESHLFRHLFSHSTNLANVSKYSSITIFQPITLNACLSS